MKKRWIHIIGSAALIMGLAVVGTSFAKLEDNEIHDGTIRIEKQVEEADFPSLAKLTPAQAVHKALAAVHGQVLKTELENENGFLVYGVEVVTAARAIVEVKVDAGSGKVLAKNLDKADDEDHERGEKKDGGDCKFNCLFEYYAEKGYVSH
ncbi:MAG: PepSY domain-containing protein [Deltaproteobacteria bacterium]|nr:PepSY domain-containing protein [Deltaproteobacteria bacterium]